MGLLLPGQFLEQPTEPGALSSSQRTWLWALGPSLTTPPPSFPTFLQPEKEGSNIPRHTCTPTWQGSSCHWESISMPETVQPRWSGPLEERQLVPTSASQETVPSPPTGYRQQVEGCALESFKPVCDLMLWFCILAKHLSRKALCHTPEAPTQGSRRPPREPPGQWAH